MRSARSATRRAHALRSPSRTTSTSNSRSAEGFIPLDLGGVGRRPFAKSGVELTELVAQQASRRADHP